MNDKYRVGDLPKSGHRKRHVLLVQVKSCTAARNLTSVCISIQVCHGLRIRVALEKRLVMETWISKAMSLV